MSAKVSSASHVEGADGAAAAVALREGLAGMLLACRAVGALAEGDGTRFVGAAWGRSWLAGAMRAGAAAVGMGEVAGDGERGAPPCCWDVAWAASGWVLVMGPAGIGMPTA